MINKKSRLINLIEAYKKREHYNFKKHNCIEKANLTMVAFEVGIPISRLGDYILLLKGLNIIGKYESSFTYCGYIFNEENFKKFKEGAK